MTGSPAAIRLLAGDPVLRRLFALLLLVALRQGLHTVAVNVVPDQVLGGDMSLVGVFVALSAVAIFIGSFAALLPFGVVVSIPTVGLLSDLTSPLTATVAVVAVTGAVAAPPVADPSRLLLRPVRSCRR